MADVSSKLRVSELDFDTIKSNLKNFLSDQNEFADYNFDGSDMSVLLDLLSYNTHYNAFYLNMIVNEMFLDTASIRNSVVSRAKHLGYTPQSVRGAKAYVDLTIYLLPLKYKTCTRIIPSRKEMSGRTRS